MSDYLDRLEAQLTKLTEEGAHQVRRTRRDVQVTAARRRPRKPSAPRGPHRARGPRRGSEILAVLAAAAVVVAVVAIVLGNVHRGKPQRTSASANPSKTTATKPHAKAAPPTQTQTGTVAASLPAQFSPRSFTAIGELTWWVLGPGPCALSSEQPPCGSIAKTTDGGRTFKGLPAPQAKLSNDGSASGYSQLRFADAKNGFAFGPDLYATHDGGETWHRVDVGGTVNDLAISGGQAFAVVGNRLMQSAVGSNSWSTVAAAGVVSGGLSVQDAAIIVQSGQGTGIGGNVLVSGDGGQSFNAHPAPSPGLPCLFSAPTPPVVWARCATGTQSGVWRSSDLGGSFTAVVSTGLSLPNSAPFAAASSSTAVVGGEQLYRTTNDGSTWSQTGPTGIHWTYLGFTDPTHGVALGFAGQNANDARLYYTIDAGQSYHRVAIP
jgi:photosystem II stability/assembly factor-like uncharacterized protein